MGERGIQMKFLRISFIFGLILSLMLNCAGALVFTDDLGRSVSVEKPEKAAFASASLAECWQLAGGEVYAVTNDAFGEHNLALSPDVIDLGGMKQPSLEVILASKPDLLILSSGLSGHLDLQDTLAKAGITHAYFDTESFEAYLSLLEIFTGLTGRQDLLEKNGTALIPRIENAVKETQAEGSRVLLLRSSSVKIKALNSETMVGSMLAKFGCENIADSDQMLLSDLSLEAIVRENPDYIFITCMGDEDEARAQIESLYASNPVWNRLKAVQNGRCHYLDKELFHYKPNVRWGESYEKLAELLSQD